jgi:MoaA/NifB/PqqE/SkfB family radical SAM enzyme
MHALIVSRFVDEYLVLRPGHVEGLKIPYAAFRHIDEAVRSQADIPAWLVDGARRAWGLELAGQPAFGNVLVRAESVLDFGRASYEVNLGCNFDCEHCYLGLKKFDGLPWSQRERLLRILRDAGVLWLQLTGGEPLIDKLYAEVHTLACELGMMVSVSSNGSRLADPRILSLLTTLRPYRIVVSVYGATAEAYEGLTRRRGSYRAFIAGLDAAREAKLPVRLNLVVARHNAHEVDAMKELAERRGLPYVVYTNISPTIYGGAESLPAQAREALRPRRPFTGCNAGHTFFHVDPHGNASICKVGRDPNVSLLDEGLDGLARLGAIADRLLLRQGGCSGCGLSANCGTCMPLAKLYRQANAPLETFCQHGQRKEVSGATGDDHPHDPAVAVTRE